MHALAANTEHRCKKVACTSVEETLNSAPFPPRRVCIKAAWAVKSLREPRNWASSESIRRGKPQEVAARGRPPCTFFRPSERVSLARYLLEAFRPFCSYWSPATAVCLVLPSPASSQKVAGWLMFALKRGKHDMLFTLIVIDFYHKFTSTLFGEGVDRA